MSGEPDPKPGRAPRRPRRLIDPAAIRTKLLADPTCRACPLPAANGHHLIRGHGREDVPENIIPLCGSGSHGCHGALHGSPYARNGERWDAARVRAAIGATLRPEERAYVLATMGEVAGLDFLARTYSVAS